MAKTKKLNKTELWEQVSAAVANVINEDSQYIKKNQSVYIAAELFEALEFLKPKAGGGTSNKIDEEGNVFCNYFECYLSEDKFNKKADGKFKANSIEAEQIIRRVRNSYKKAQDAATESFRAKLISDEELMNILNRAEDMRKVKYASVAEVPDILNELLKETMNSQPDSSSLHDEFEAVSDQIAALEDKKSAMEDQVDIDNDDEYFKVIDEIAELEEKQAAIQDKIEENEGE